MIRRLVFALCALLAAGNAFAATPPPTPTDEASRLIQVQPGDAWTLVGEWTREGSDAGIPGALYTLAIIALGDAHYRVLSGTVVTGCCYWPTVSRLDTLAPSTFFDPAFASRYEVEADGSLSVHRQGEPAQRLAATPEAARFSRRWSPPARAPAD